MSIDWRTDKTWKRVFEPLENSGSNICAADPALEDDEPGSSLGIKTCLIKIDEL
jgi:hypothetical protein